VNGYSKYTPLRIAVPFILGIAGAVSFRIDWPAGLILQIATVCFLCLLLAHLFLRANFSLRWISGLFASLALFFTGCFMISAIDQRLRLQMKEEGEFSPGSFFLCNIDDSPVEKTSTCLGNAVIIAKKDSLGQWHPFEASIQVYFKDDSLCKTLGYGDLIVISGALQTIPGPANPHMFSYRQYLYNRQICYQVFLDSGRWQRVGMAARNPVRVGAEICRGKFMETLRKFKIEGQEFGLVSALLLGRQELVDSEIKQEFSHAGVIHVLSVSGLHVGIMYVVADKTFFFLKRSRKTRKLHAILILVFIWAYSFITGLPSSVMRAALMFSLISAGRMFKRSSDNYNILAVAAFFQLCINPYEITQVGFLLSYLAVLGIFTFYEPFNNLLSSDNRLLTWVWALLAVSVAAQVATFPLACYYFNMFPVYFLLANLIVVPLAAVITYFTLPLLAVGAAGLTYEWIAWPLKWSLRLMQGSVELIQSWPGAVIEPVILTTAQVILIYIAIASFFALWVLSDRRWAFVILGTFILFSFISAWRLYERLKTNEIIVYQVNGNTAIDLIHDGYAYFISDSLLINDQKKIDFQIRPNRIYEGIMDVQIVKTEEQTSLSFPGVWINYPFIYFRGKTIAIIDNQWKTSDLSRIIPCDLVIFSGKPPFDPVEFKSDPNLKEIIIDSSVPFYKAGQMLQAFKNENVPCHSVRHEGAFVLKW
jgi:competence protein ComEC